MRGRSRVSTNNRHFFKSVFFYRMEKISLRCNNKPGRSQPGFTCPTSRFTCLGERVADIKKLGISFPKMLQMQNVSQEMVIENQETMHSYTLPM